MPEIYLTDALGCNGKPMFRVHTAGSVGGSTALVAASHVQSRAAFRRVLTVAFEKQSESNAMWALSQPFSPSGPPERGVPAATSRPSSASTFVARARPTTSGIKVAVKDRLHGAKQPVGPPAEMPDITMERGGGVLHALGSHPLPGVLPLIDGACAMVLIANEELAGQGEEAPAWIRGVAMRSEPLPCLPGREEVNPQAGRDCAADVYRAGRYLGSAAKTLTARRVYVPFSWYEPMWLENLGFCGGGPGLEADRLEGATSLRSRGATSPWNCLRRRHCPPTPSAPAGMIRFAEAARQVRGDGGRPPGGGGAGMAMGHAYGGGCPVLLHVDRGRRKAR